MRRVTLVVGVVIAVVGGVACSHPESPRLQQPGPPSAAPIDAPLAAVVVDAPEPSQDERLAAIQKAMNELDEAVQGCWAVVATERFDIEGDMVAQIEISAGRAVVGMVSDTTRTPRLATCVTAVLTSYPWAPPLRGQTIQLPFRFRAPSDGQNVIDRSLVSAAGQGTIRLSVLLDENNSANATASLVEIAIAGGGTTGMRRADRAELWYFKTAAEVRGPNKPFAVAPGDMMFVPTSGVREVIAKPGAVTAVIAFVPGGREGAARAGALPTPEQTLWKETPPGPRLLAAKTATTYPRGPGKVTIFAEAATLKSPAFGASVLEFPAGMVVPEHVHDRETEILYVLEGTGTMTVKGVALAVTATSVVQIPAATKHAFTATTALRAVQIYTPAGPEQRFKVK